MIASCDCDVAIASVSYRRGKRTMIALIYRGSSKSVGVDREEGKFVRKFEPKIAVSGGSG